MALGRNPGEIHPEKMCLAFPYDGMSRVRFKGTLSIPFWNTPKAVANVEIINSSGKCSVI